MLRIWQAELSEGRSEASQIVEALEDSLEQAQGELANAEERARTARRDAANAQKERDRALTRAAEATSPPKLAVEASPASKLLGGTAKG